MPVNVFISYAPEDEKLCQELIKHLRLLQRQRVISAWYNRLIIAGQDRQEVINKQLEDALIILLLISVDFMASDYLHDIEMEYAMQRHNAGEARVIPIRLRPSDWDNAPFASLESIPPIYEKTIGQYEKKAARDGEWLKVVSGIRRVINHLSVSEANIKDRANRSVRSPTEANISTQDRVSIRPPGETSTNNSNSTLTSPVVGSPQVQQLNNANHTSRNPPFNRRWFLVISLLIVFSLMFLSIGLFRPSWCSSLLCIQRNVPHPPIQAGKFQFTDIPIITADNPHPLPVSTVQGKDGNLWFTDDANEIGRVTPKGIMTEVALTNAGPGADYPTGITTGPDGNIWFTLIAKAAIGRVNLKAPFTVSAITYFKLPTQEGAGTSITTGPDGNLWYVLGGAPPAKDARIGCITVAGTSCGDYDLGIGVNPSSIISAGGKLWFTEFDNNSIGWLIPGSQPHIISLPGIKPFNMVSGPNGEIWFTEPNVGRLGHIHADGSHLAEVPLTNLVVPESIASGLDGTLWFTVWAEVPGKSPGGSIERLSPDGTITSYPFPTPCYPTHNNNEYDNGNGITVASNGQIWFTEDEDVTATSKIAHSL